MPVASMRRAVAFHFGALGQLEERPPNQATAAAANGSSVPAIAMPKKPLLDGSFKIILDVLVR